MEALDRRVGPVAKLKNPKLLSFLVLGPTGFEVNSGLEI